jgi:hypothetical protein
MPGDLFDSARLCGHTLNWVENLVHLQGQLAIWCCKQGTAVNTQVPCLLGYGVLFKVCALVMILLHHGQLQHRKQDDRCVTRPPAMPGVPRETSQKVV